METHIFTPGFRRWIEASLAESENILATSNQGTLLLYREGPQPVVIKTPMGRGLVLKARAATLQREYQAYQRLKGLTGVPRCYGLVDQSYLVLEHVQGTPYRQAEFSDRARWFDEFLQLIEAFHRRGVSHGDLKSKSNILVTREQKPCVIDFGTTFLHKTGFHPLNNYLFNYSKRLDINAWVKHKYHGRYQDASAADRERLNYSLLEKLLRRFRPG